ncbi:hypothetical protein RU639_003445 [Aspergillus parasiticus]
MIYTRHSIQQLQEWYDAGNREPLDKFVRAFKYIQDLPADHDNSFHKLGGYHGEPFHYEKAPPNRSSKWWGGYCFHGCVLFPTWHRAYMLRFEQALRTAPGCEDVTLPFWDECAGLVGRPSIGLRPHHLIPRVLTTRTYELDGQTIPNPLFSFKLKQKIEDLTVGKAQQYSKPEGYETVRYPLSGMVGTQEDQENTKVHNARFSDAKSERLLNVNITNWLITGPRHIPTRPGAKPPSDTTSVLARYLKCLDTDTYTIFSNTTSQTKLMEKLSRERNEGHWLMSLESPHNGIHLAIGGFFQQGEDGINADEIDDANGDMGDNETAGFDPIFFLHHGFIDYVFWQWQLRHGATETLTIDEGDPGAKVPEGGILDLPEGEQLTMDTPLPPIIKPGEKNYYTSKDMVNIESLGYTYGSGSLDKHHAPILHTPHVPVKQMVKISSIFRNKHKGSFVIRTYATGPGCPEPIEIGREPILNRWNVSQCANCQNHLEAVSMIPLDAEMLAVLLGDDWEKENRTVDEIKYQVEIHARSEKKPNNEIRKRGKFLFSPTPVVGRLVHGDGVPAILKPPVFNMPKDMPTVEHLLRNKSFRPERRF